MLDMMERIAAGDVVPVALRPCPLCGGTMDFEKNLAAYDADGFLDTWLYAEYYGIVCDKCNLRLFDYCVEDLVEKWNHRAAIE